VSARLGVDPDSLQRLKPGLIVLETTGYGSSGPSGQRPGYDMVLQAFCGFEDLAGGEGNPPVWDRTTMLDYGAGLCGAAGLLMALIHRQRSGAGASISTCLLNAGLFMLSELIKQPDGTFTGARKLNHAQTGFHPAESVYQTADNWIAIHAPTDTTAQGLLRALYLATSHSPARADWGAVEYAALGRAIRQWGTDILRERLDLFGVWSEPVLNDGNEWLLDQNLKSNHTVAVTHDSKYGDVTMLGQMFRLSGRRPTDHSMVPSLGANSREILLELGFSKAMVDDFYARKIVA
jgi:crotonobetainyl-CoA:carnitine CoA-transferase CaiB-like acyl-CoA transferase